MTDKARLRAIFLQKRQSLSLETWQVQSLRLCEQLQTCPLYQAATTVLAYFSVRQEPDLTALFSSEKIWGFPRCVKEKLVYHRWQVNEPLKQGKYGILEPFDHSPLLSPTEVDLILIPALACDRQGYRLGYGGGFYDRLLSSSLWRDIPTLGITFEFAYVNEIPQDPWDQRLLGVCTEQQWQLF